MNGTTVTGLQASGSSRAPLLDDDDAALFPKLTEGQVQLLSPRGEVRSTASGEVLFREGDPIYDVAESALLAQLVKQARSHRAADQLRVDLCDRTVPTPFEIHSGDRVDEARVHKGSAAANGEVWLGGRRSSPHIHPTAQGRYEPSWRVLISRRLSYGGETRLAWARSIHRGMRAST